MTTKTTKIIRTSYLYLAALISLIFVAVGAGTFLNTALKAYVFPEAEKSGFGPCNNQPPMTDISGPQSVEKAKNSDLTTNDQKAQIDALLKDYQTWKDNNAGDKCYNRERQGNFVNSLTMLIIALPICLIHWRIIKKDKEEKETEIV